MALVKCKDCGRSVSDKATACNACGCPIGGGSGGASAFEKRIEQYKAVGYILSKRSGNTVNMVKKITAKQAALSMLIPFVLYSVLVVLNMNTRGYIPFSSHFVFVIGIVSLLIVCANKNKAIISLTTTGKIEETGNVLKKK